MEWLDDISTTFTDLSSKVGSTSDAVSGAYTKVVDLVEKVKLGASGPAPTATTAPAPAADQAATYATAGEGFFDHAADSLGISRGALKWGVFGLLGLGVAFAAFRLFKRGR